MKKKLILGILFSILGGFLIYFGVVIATTNYEYKEVDCVYDKGIAYCTIEYHVIEEYKDDYFYSIDSKNYDFVLIQQPLLCEGLNKIKYSFKTNGYISNNKNFLKDVLSDLGMSNIYNETFSLSANYIVKEVQ